MKKLSAIAACLFLFSISLFAQNETLRGDEAINQLQKTGQYDSLMDAVRDARKENGQTDEPQTEDAIGQTTKLTATGGAANDFFGWSVAISGDTAIVGANADDVGANANQGSAYIFTRSGTVWTQQQQIFATGGAAGDQFGYAVAIHGDTAIIGANFDIVSANTDQGSAYVFVRSGIVWTQQAQLTATGGAASDRFGNSVAISGDKIIVGAPFSDVSVNVPFAPQAADQGAVFMFVNNFAPTAAGVSVGGRILNADGIGVRNAIVSLTLANGEVLTTRSSAFGYYNFDDLEAGQTIVVSVISKRFQFVPQVVTLNESVAELNFWAQ